MHYETVSLRDVLSLIRGSRRQAIMSVNHEYRDEPDYIRHMDRELQLKLGNSIARDIQPSWYTFTRDPNQLQQRSIETWVLTREQVDAIVMVLMKLAEKMNSFDIRIPIQGEFDVTPEFTKGR